MLMNHPLRKTGLRILGDVPWGTHIGQLFENEKDQLEILVPFFKAGLKSREYCVWMCSEPLGVKEAARALRRAVPKLDAYLDEGRIEILALSDRGSAKRTAGLKKAVTRWKDRVGSPAAGKYEGLRLSADAAWLETRGGRRSGDGEKYLRQELSLLPAIALWGFALDRHDIPGIIDIGRRFPLTLLRRSGKWSLLEIADADRAGAALRESERRLRLANDLLEAVTKGTDVIMAAQDRDFRYVFFNQGYAAEIKRLTGKDLRIGMTMTELFAEMPEQLAVARSEWARALRGESVRERIEFGDPARHRRIYDALKSPLYDSAGCVWGAGEVAYDVTRQARVEDALRRSEERLRLAQESSGVGVWDWKVPTGVLDLSPQMEKLYGLEPGTIRTYDDWRRRTHPEDIERIEAGRDLAIASREPFDLEFRILHASGDIRWILAKGGAVYDEAGRVVRVFGVNVDITERKRFEEALRESRDELERRIEERTRDLAGAVEDLQREIRERQRNEELLRNVFENVPVGIWVLDRDGTIVYGNPEVRRIWGDIRYVGIEGYGTYKAWNPDTGEPLKPEERDSIRAVTKGETVLNKEIEIESSDGMRKFILNSAVPLRDASGQISGAIALNQDITLRRESEKARREQAALLDLAHDAIFDCALDGTILFWNRGAEVMYGWSKGEALGKISHVLLHSRFPEPIECITEKIVRTGRWEGEFSQIDRRGAPLQTSGRWALKTDEKGRPVGILKINIDITERKQAEDRLRASSRNTRNLIEASLDPLVTISPEGKITDVNKATEVATGVSREALVGSDFSDYFTEPLKAKEGYRLAFSEGTVRDYPLAIRSVSGEVTDVLYNATVFRNDDGEVQGVFAAARDVSQRLKVEAERLRLAKAIEQAAEGIIILDTEREILYVNPAFESITGLRSPDILRSTYDDILRMMGAEPDVERRIGESFRGGEFWNGPIDLKKAGGGPFTLNVVISPVRDESGSLMNFVIVNRDVTEEIRIQEHLRQAQKMEALGTLAGGIAHDFNNLLMPILVNSEMALMDAPEGSALSRHLELVREAANRGKELVKQITAFARRKEMERRPIEIGPIVREGLKFLRASISKNIEITEDIRAGAALVLADPTQIHQVLMNLCSNAAYAMRRAGGVLGVGLSEFEVDANPAGRNPDLKPGPFLKLTVSDIGEGMAPDVLEKIFDPFFTTKAPGEGTGMGLAVVHGIVKSHGGAVTVRSESGKGTTFDVYLPRTRGDRDRSGEDPGRLPTGNERILFIDDEEINMRTILPMLERLGYRATGRTNAPQALELVRARPDDYDLVITDLSMPHLMGDKLAMELLRLRPDLPIILSTGYSETISEALAKVIGIRSVLPKPFTLKAIAFAIRRALDGTA
jgi:PAS domain S-box-containing protein